MVKSVSFRKRLLKVPVLGPWLSRRDDRRFLREIENDYRPKIEAAKKAKDANEVESLEAHQRADIDMALDPGYAEESKRLVDKARGFRLKVPPIHDEGDAWFRSSTTGDWILTDDAEFDLRRAIDNERRIRSDEFRKWAAFIFGVLGFALGFSALYTRQKQPDACPRNYYRDDAGACVFALSPQQQPSSTLQPNSKKPGKP